MGFNLTKGGRQVIGLYRRPHPGIEGKGIALFMVKTQVEMLEVRSAYTVQKTIVPFYY